MKRDQHFEEKHLASAALAALGAGIKDIAEEDDQNMASFVGKLNDATKLVNHLLFEQTEAHKAFVLPIEDKQHKIILKEAETDNFLFQRRLFFSASAQRE